MASYSVAQKEKILKYSANHTLQDTAEKFGISVATVSKWRAAGKGEEKMAATGRKLKLPENVEVGSMFMAANEQEHLVFQNSMLKEDNLRLMMRVEILEDLLFRSAVTSRARPAMRVAPEVLSKLNGIVGNAP